MKQPSCLVTGATGFLGDYVVPVLQAAGWQVTTLGRRPRKGFKWIQSDLAKGPADLSGCSITHVFHLAGLAHRKPRSEEERELFFKVNTQGTRHLLQSLDTLTSPPEALLYISTISVYGILEGTQLDEETSRNASDPYGLSKKQAEDLILDWGRKGNIRTTLVRLPPVAGKHNKGNLGKMVRYISKGWYFGIGDGKNRNSVVLACDVAEILPSLAALGGVFHLTDGDHPSMLELEAAVYGSLKKGKPVRIPMTFAKLLAGSGDLLEKWLEVEMPFNSRSLAKMTSSLTFSDLKARKCAGWHPSRIVDKIEELAI